MKSLGFIVLVFSIFKTSHGACRDITLDNCDYGENVPFESTKGIDKEICQQFCSDIYPNRCKFFIYDTKQEVCQLFDTEVSDYVNTCKKIGGPRSPDVMDECPTDPDECTVSFFRKFFASSHATFLKFSAWI